MAKTDWDFVIDGIGSWAIVSEGGSMRLQFIYNKVFALWNGRNDLANSEIIAELRFNNVSTLCRGGFILRSDGTKNNMYLLYIYYDTSDKRRFNLYRVVDNVWTILVDIKVSSIPPASYIPTRFRIDGWQLSCHVYYEAEWHEVFFKDDELQSHSQGYAGMAGFSTYASYRASFDNVEIRERT